MNENAVIRPDWPAPAGVNALSTTRRGGVSTGPWESLNLGTNCGDEGDRVVANRARLANYLPAEPIWLQQVHGNRVMELGAGEPGTRDFGTADLPPADAAVTAEKGVVLSVLTADCLPVLLCDKGGLRVGVAHAGWRGLAGGVIESTVECMRTPPENLVAWLGPAIGGAVYEVGSDVHDAFAAAGGYASQCLETAFVVRGDRWLFDPAAAGRGILTSLGVKSVHGGGFCTFSDPGRFFSYRRDGTTGRMATLIWMEHVGAN